MATLPTIVMDQAADVIRGLQATIAALRTEIAELRLAAENASREIEGLREDNQRLTAKARRQSGVMRRERKATTW